jgi:hypothetical protein
MATSFTLTADRIIDITLQGIKPQVEKATNALYMAIRMNSPVRTGKFLGQNRNMGVRIEGNSMIGEVINEGAYPERVEFGFGRGGRIGGRMTAVRWHLLNGQIYVDK